MHKVGGGRKHGDRADRGQCDDAFACPNGLSPGRLSSCVGGGSSCRIGSCEVASTVSRLRRRLRWDDAAGASEESAGKCDSGDAHKRNDENYGEHWVDLLGDQVVGQGPVLVMQHPTGRWMVTVSAPANLEVIARAEPQCSWEIRGFSTPLEPGWLLISGLGVRFPRGAQTLDITGDSPFRPVSRK